jgi:ribose-phosphate pyrophosphokinase
VADAHSDHVSETTGVAAHAHEITREIPTRKVMMVYSGTAHPRLAEEIAENLGISLCETKISRFASGEIYVRSIESARGADAFVIQTHADPINEAIMEQLVMIDALKRASAKRITAVIPYYGYSRQDHKALAREPISAKLVADLLTVAGADRVISVDLHSGQIQGFFDFPVDHLTAMPLLADYLKEHLSDPEEVVVVSPDAGRIKSAQRLQQELHSDLAFIYKRRSRHEAHKIEQVVVVGDVVGRRCVLIDDMIDTAGTVVEGAKGLAAGGATDIVAACTHPVLSGKAVQRIVESPIKELVVTNTIPITDEKASVLGDRLTVLSIAPIVASALDAVFEDESVSEIFHGENQP